MPSVTYRDPSGALHALQGEEGTSVMDLAMKNGVPGIVGECGGFLNCASCHVYVADEWTQAVGPASEEEDEMLDCSLGERLAGSRLSCQVVLSDDLNGLHVDVAPGQ